MANGKRESVWEPHFRLSLKNGTASAFAAMTGEFEQWRQGQPVPKPLPDGWHTITPQMAEQLLLLNALGANRKAVWAAIVYYALQMLAGDWPATGQPLIFKSDGSLGDGQHRLWACYLSGVSFKTYVVNQVEEIESGFAYIDNSKVRTVKDALQTGGMNGLSGRLAQAIDVSYKYELGAFTATKVLDVPRLSPRHAILYAHERPNLLRGVHLSDAEYADATEMIGHAQISAFVAYKVLDLYGEPMMAEFMSALGNAQEAEDGSAIDALQQLFVEDRRIRTTRKGEVLKHEPMKPHMVLACVITAFHAWRTNAPMTLKKATLGVSETFPRFEVTEEDEQAAA